MRMKTPGAVLLLLWSGVVVVSAESGGLQHEAPGASATSDEKISLSDVNTLLREMKTLLTEQTEELRLAKAQLVTLETRLNASEKTAETMETRLRASEGQISTLQTTDAAQAANLNLTAGQVEELRREREERRVSFSASVVTSGAGNIGPYSAATTLIYRNVISNIGNGYNKNTGVFTAPVRGVYHFAVSLSGSGSRAAAVHLYKNGAHVVIAYTHTQNSFTSSSNGASLLLEVGDVVYVNLGANAWVYDDMERYTTFSGHLLFTM